ncbi:CLUMA_CG010897, isoform A [Clunio marinus]|uniref:CLUMA_CG010897, isoform A n=1 Tax=Clunio marinus TaxID=568069 RepID=A0A1J1ID76_9DIPT|nr:CLUMA_CG010897, isoform A [Clunio marinus]
MPHRKSHWWSMLMQKYDRVWLRLKLEQIYVTYLHGVKASLILQDASLYIKYNARIAESQLD